ncbi:hypothetical protein MKW94_021176 [Papaver nudicaule]|uniref:RNA polymerase sigma factor n=1 Tax=Papaver nudicaule TaxID=74823 RepID=A0AA41VKS1_PAPNU|nr:hypothetical protein [Papaver nudicaule]
METSRNLLSSPPFIPSKHQLRNSPPLFVAVLHEQAALAVTAVQTTSITRHFPASVLLQEQRDDLRSSLHLREEKPCQAALDRTQIDDDESIIQAKKDHGSDKYLKDFERQLLYSPGLWYLLPPSQRENKVSEMQSMSLDTDEALHVKACDLLALAKQALMVSKQAASLIVDSNSNLNDVNELIPSSGLNNVSNLEKEVIVRSTRLLERQSKKRRAPKLALLGDDISSLRTTDRHHKTSLIDLSDPLRLFLSGAEARQLLTAKEEKELFIQVQELTRLEEVKQKLQSQFDREPTVVEWAEAVGMSCGTLQLHLHLGHRSREKMIYSNFRMVVHVAKNYQGKGMNLQDLLQEGSKGLIKSLEKFKPHAGCRFSTYAYWWIRQSIRKAIFHHSKSIRLPENVYNALKQVKNAKEVLIKEGHQPTNEEIAKQVGFTVGKLERLLITTKTPLSMQRPIWADQSTTFQAVTADPKVETPEQGVSKDLMRRHVRNLLSVLPPKEKRIIRLRYGIEDGEQKSLAQIGDVFGLSKERVRQLENRALDKLRNCLSSQGLEAYTNLLT